ncbi:hypothetical protein HAX54_001468 [Datura stramonium]|uniref:Mon2/Sec7/BIG1-like dimerisation and cyclophilin-binding domain-containing protein n=1 Tax=Datura stramonium TaxID=4076 RepID=A0ABS8T337_DATST|nr:hypothetical protein [Datura stramonium]
MVEALFWAIVGKSSSFIGRSSPAISCRQAAARARYFEVDPLSSPSEIAHNEDILKIFLMACEVRTVKMSVIGLSCLLAHFSRYGAPSALKEILDTLKDHGEIADETLQLKTLQTILLFPSNVNICMIKHNCANTFYEYNAQALGIILRLLENNRSSDSVRITSDVNRNINHLESLEQEFSSGGPSLMRDILTKSGKLALRLLEDLTALAAGGSAVQLRVSSIQRTFALDILE